MLPLPPHYHHSLPDHVSHRLPLRRIPSFTATLRLSSATSFSSSPISASSSSSVPDRRQEPAQPPRTTIPEDILRKHNAKSTAVILHGSAIANQPRLDSKPEEERLRILELSLVTKRTPQFPGSIYIQPSQPEASKPPLANIFDGESDEDDEEMIMRAVEIRRNVTMEIFKEAMRKGKFGITYSNNLLSRLTDFIDYVMIEAASMKQLPEFSNSTFNVRAKTVIQDSNVVPLIRWLKHNSLSYPRIGKLICMSRGKLETIRRLVEWLKTIHVKGEFLGFVIMKAGDDILDRNIEELDEIARYLENNGVRRDWMGAVMSRCPQLLSYNIEELKTRVEFYLGMGMNEKDFGTMVFDYPKALGYFTLQEMNEKVIYLKEFGLNNEDVGRLLAFKPLLMGCSIEEKLKPLVKYLYYLGIRRDGMRRVLIIKPMIFCVDLEKTIVPKVRFFQDIGIRDDAIGNMLAKFPPLLTYSLYKKIRPVVIFLITKAGVSRKDIAKVIALGPELLGCSIVHKLEVNVKYFLSLGIPLRLVGEMIADFPMLLRYNIDVLRPKYRYLRRTMVRPLKDLIEFPRFFSYSLDDRIIPRHRALVENRVNFKLRYMLASSDEEFAQRVEAAVERRTRFESGIVGDILSGSQTTIDSVEKHTLVDSCGSEVVFSDCQTTDCLVGENQPSSSTTTDSPSFSSETNA